MANNTPQWFTAYLKHKRKTDTANAWRNMGGSLGTGISAGIVNNQDTTNKLRQTILDARMKGYDAYVGDQTASDEQILKNPKAISWKPKTEKTDFKTEVLKLAQDPSIAPEIQKKLWDVLGADVGEKPTREYLTPRQQFLKGELTRINNSILAQEEALEKRMTDEQLDAFLSTPDKTILDAGRKELGLNLPSLFETGTGTVTKTQPISKSPGALRSFFDVFGKTLGNVGASMVTQKIGGAAQPPVTQPTQPTYKIGEIVLQGGKNYKIIGFYPDGTPKGVEVK
jgi:hypothetical protein